MSINDSVSKCSKSACHYFAFVYFILDMWVIVLTNFAFSLNLLAENCRLPRLKKLHVSLYSRAACFTVTV